MAHDSCEHDSNQGGNDEFHITSSRRTFLLLGVSALLTGCAKKELVTTLPGPVWKPRPLPPGDRAPTPTTPTTPSHPGAVSRNRWALGKPVTTLMNRMLPVRYITVHHDGMTPFTASDERSSAARLESIRRSHRDRGWGDIGYHYAVDRSGRIWEGRPVSYQGAHVKDRNEHNLGIVALGNFDRQSPTSQQLAALNRQVTFLMQKYNVSINNVYTHQEWPGAVTACPGTNLQRYMVAVRRNRQLG